MPFKKIGPDRYESPSGRKLSGEQVKAYYAKKHDRRRKQKKARRRK